MKGVGGEKKAYFVPKDRETKDSGKKGGSVQRKSQKKRGTGKEKLRRNCGVKGGPRAKKPIVGGGKNRKGQKVFRKGKNEVGKMA